VHVRVRGTSVPLTVAGVPQPSPPRRGPPKPALILRRIRPVSAERQSQRQGKTPAEAVGYHRLVMLVATPSRRSPEAKPSRSHVTSFPNLPRRRRVHTRAQLVARGKQRLSAITCPSRARANAAAAFRASDDARGTEQPTTAVSFSSGLVECQRDAWALRPETDYPRSPAPKASESRRAALARGTASQVTPARPCCERRARMGLASLGNDLEARTPPKLPEPARPVSTSEERLGPSA
jgi:hypothetical protein